MIHLVLAAALAASSPGDTLSDEALVAYASQPYDKAKKFNHEDVLGINHGVEVVVDFPCSDLCPYYTVRIIHYAVAPGPDCGRIGGVSMTRKVPVSITVAWRQFCVPRVLVERGLH